MGEMTEWYLERNEAAERALSEARRELRDALTEDAGS